VLNVQTDRLPVFSADNTCRRIFGLINDDAHAGHYKTIETHYCPTYSSLRVATAAWQSPASCAFVETLNLNVAVTRDLGDYK
jgi:hypothetical protein